MGKMKLFSLLSVAFAEQRSFFGNAVYRLENITDEAIAVVKQLNKHQPIDFWAPESAVYLEAGQTVDLHLENAQRLYLDFHLAELDQMESIVHVMDNLDEKIETQKARSTKDAFSFEEYHDYDEIKSYVKSLSGDDVEYKVYGSSVEGRELFAVEIGSGDSVIAIDCGIHAREWISPAYCMWFLNELDQGEFAQYRNDFKFVVQPLINPDGYSYTWSNDRMWRKNRRTFEGALCVGTDLNRNYDSNWGGAGSTPNKCSETYRGESAFSEPESQGQRDYLNPMKEKIDAFLTFHSYSQYILYPYSWQNPVPPKNQEELEEVGNKMKDAIFDVHGKTYVMGQTISIFYPASGGSDDWGYDIQLEGQRPNPLSYTFELRDKGRYGFLLPPDEIKPTSEEINAAMHAMLNHIKNRT